MNATSPRTDGLVALVTGGASGIGLATASALLDAGVRVTIADTGTAAAQASADHLGASHPGKVNAVVADVSTQHGARRAVDQTIDQHGHLDLLHLNAGRPGVGVLTADTDLDAAQQSLVTNVMSTVAPFIAALPHLEHRPSAAVTVTSSLAGVIASPADPMYAASKHALIGLVRSLAPAHRSIRVNAVCPSLVDTPMLGHGLPEGHPLPVLAPQDVARVVVEQLLGDEDGEVLFIESGRSPRPVAEPRLSSLQPPPL
ncbi:MAG: SDR family oxidoreductase [Nocardioidaceae bacterium]|nr:SDR family oxidoreductase [Nocardioidaceae bacterium]